MWRMIHAPMMWSADDGKCSRVLMLSFVTCSRHICLSGTPGCLLYFLSNPPTPKSRVYLSSIFDTSSPPPQCFWWIKYFVVCHCGNGVILISTSVLFKQFPIALSPLKILDFVSWVDVLKALWDFLRQLT